MRLNLTNRIKKFETPDNSTSLCERVHFRKLGFVDQPYCISATQKEPVPLNNPVIGLGKRWYDCFCKRSGVCPFYNNESLPAPKDDLKVLD
jgi:hypothetical protein